MNLYRADADTLIGADFHQAPQWYQSNFGSLGQNSGFCSENIFVLNLADFYLFAQRFFWGCLDLLVYGGFRDSLDDWVGRQANNWPLQYVTQTARMPECDEIVCVLLFVPLFWHQYFKNFCIVWHRVFAHTRSVSDLHLSFCGCILLKLENNSVSNALVTCHRVILWKLVWSFLHLFALSWSEVWSRLITAVGWSLSPSTRHQS